MREKDDISRLDIRSRNINREFRGKKCLRIFYDVYLTFETFYLSFIGVQIGNIFANFLSGFIIRFIPGGWPNVFYFFGIASIVWFAVWCLCVFNDPLSHPYISQEELDYLQQSIGCLERKKVRYNTSSDT